MKTPQEKVDLIIQQKLQGLSSRKIAENVLGRKSKKSTVNDIYNAWLNGTLESTINVHESTKDKLKSHLAKVLTLDVETSMHEGYFFQLFGRVNIKPMQIKTYPYMLTFACKWLHEDKVVGYKLPDFPLWKTDKKTDYALVNKLWEYMNEADIVIAHNARFDMGWFTQQCILHGFPPVSPVKVICTYKALKSITSLPSKSLDYSTQYFRTLDEKLKHGGQALWIRCMEGDESAFDEMLEYNLGDIPTCEELYLKIRPFMKNHPNVGLYMKTDHPVCLACGSDDLHLMKETSKTAVSEFPTYRCGCCGKIQRGGKAIKNKVQQMRNVM